MRIDDFRLQSAVLRIVSKPKAESGKPKLSRGRRGVSILEVLFAILVTVIGLLGVVAIFPVASMMARKGRMKDAVSVASMTAIHQFDTQGMRRDAGWMEWDSTTSTWVTYTHVFGRSVCIDPRMLAAPATTGSEARASVFPYQSGALPPYEPQMRRITLNGGSGVMGKLQADTLFTFEDDLNYDRPPDRSLEPGQIFDELPSMPGTPSERQSEGHMSWMATLVPKVDRYSLTTDGQYVLSIVVFFDRPADLDVNDPDNSQGRVLGVSTPLAGGGVTGGEVLLTASSEAELKIRPDDWIMLAGSFRHAVDNPAGSGNPRYIGVFRWYRVVDCEPQATFNTTTSNWERYVTLYGQDWDSSLMATSLRAVVVDGVVGVYEKTVTLED